MTAGTDSDDNLLLRPPEGEQTIQGLVDELLGKCVPDIVMGIIGSFDDSYSADNDVLIEAFLDSFLPDTLLYANYDALSPDEDSSAYKLTEDERKLWRLMKESYENGFEDRDSLFAAVNNRSDVKQPDPFAGVVLASLHINMLESLHNIASGRFDDSDIKAVECWRDAFRMTLDYWIALSCDKARNANINDGMDSLEKPTKQTRAGEDILKNDIDPYWKLADALVDITIFAKIDRAIDKLLIGKHPNDGNAQEDYKTLIREKIYNLGPEFWRNADPESNKFKSFLESALKEITPGSERGMS